jgi:hypothetical protein
MPWKEVNVMEVRKQFIRDFKLEPESVTSSTAGWYWMPTACPQPANWWLMRMNWRRNRAIASL